MSRGDLIDWIDSTGSDIAKHVNNYRRQPNDVTAAVMKETALALAVMCDELAGRRRRS
jgi:hypothetical protein